MVVVITGDRITEMGKIGHVHVPKNAEIVDETGKFLIPGLWDMHVHWYAKEYLPLFIANGVTGIRIMWGQPIHHQWRKEIEQGTLLGPRMVIASPIVDGPNPFWPGSIGVANEEDARLVVARVKRDGTDFGVSVGLAGTVVSYSLIGAGTVSGLTVDEDTYSTTSDTAFRWDSTGKQWIFNQATGKNNPTLSQTNTIYRFRITLKDGSTIQFQYGLK